MSVPSRHPAYGLCLPIVHDLACADIIWTPVQVYDVYNDSYDLDAVGVPGNGWTYDGIG
jgi:hypothetical protein